MVWYDMVWKGYGMALFGIVWHGRGRAWHGRGMVWHVMVRVWLEWHGMAS